MTTKLLLIVLTSLYFPYWSQDNIDAFRTKRYREYLPFLNTLKTSRHYLEYKELKGISSVKIKEVYANIKDLETQLQKGKTLRKFIKS